MGGIGANTKATATVTPKIYGIIDAHAHHSAANTLPAKYGLIDKDGILKLKYRTNLDTDKILVDGKDISKLSTEDIGNFLVELNTKMYNSSTQIPVAGTSNKKDIPSLVITSTMDMGLAGYNGARVNMLEAPVQCWYDQIEETKAAVVANPLRLFPLFSYDPRRYWCQSPYKRPLKYVRFEDREQWDYPFAYIIGHDDPTPDRIWLGFSMNPQLGFRPFDEYCEYLPNFYEECADRDIPIIAHCAPEGVITSLSETYDDFDAKNYMGREEKSTARGRQNREGVLRSNMYCGIEKGVSTDPKQNHFYRNYGHPRNWIPVLKHCYDLRLCLTHFGGNSEWGHPSMDQWIKVKDHERHQLPPMREWIRCIIKLTKYYKDVYVDISGLNINAPKIRIGLQKMLRLIKRGHDDFKHLKYKLIFGSDWYFTYLTNTNKSKIEHNYGKYCNDFKGLFMGVDQDGELWKHVSLINPWHFYALSDKKFEAVRSVLPRLASEIKVSSPPQGVINAIYDVLKKDGGLGKDIPDKNGLLEISQRWSAEKDGDLIAIRDGKLITLDDLIKINNNENLGKCKYYIDALNEILPKYDIHTPLRIAHFLAQVIHETGYLSSTTENLSYSVDGLLREFSDYFTTTNEPLKKDPNDYARNSVKTANYIYAQRMLNGKEESGDGYKYRGRGLMQLTGREDYGKCGKALGLDLLNDPDILTRDINASVSSACWVWTINKQLNKWADEDNIHEITRRINGGTKGIIVRTENLGRAKKVLDIS